MGIRIAFLLDFRVCDEISATAYLADADSGGDSRELCGHGRWIPSKALRNPAGADGQGASSEVDRSLDGQSGLSGQPQG